MGRVGSCALVQMNRNAVTKTVKSCDLLLLRICLFNAHTFTETLFLFDPHCPILFNLGSTPSTSPLMLTLTLEGTFRMLVYKITELRDYQTCLPDLTVSQSPCTCPRTREPVTTLSSST